MRKGDLRARLATLRRDLVARLTELLEEKRAPREQYPGAAMPPGKRIPTMTHGYLLIERVALDSTGLAFHLRRYYPSPRAGSGVLVAADEDITVDGLMAVLEFVT